MRLTAAAIVLTTGMALAAPPPNADGRFADWFRSLKDGMGHSCCDISDCRRTTARIGPAGYQARTPEGDWVDVPTEKIIRRDNPVGDAVMCWLPGRGVMCFVPPLEA